MIAIGRSAIEYLTGAVASVFTLLVVLGVVLYLASRLLGIDLDPWILGTAQTLSGGRLINFEEAFVGDSNSGLRVCEVERMNADGDNFKEWVVSYQYDVVGEKSWRQPCPDKSPRAVAIYDNDRGEPAVLFPYKLQSPDSDYLGEGPLRIERVEMVPNLAETTDPIQELLVYGDGAGTTERLTIFKYQQNTAPWDSPTNAGDQPRYRVLGSFSGTGGVSFDPKTMKVTVLDRGPFDRSQLAVKNVYELRGDGNDQTYMTEVGAASLDAPINSTIDFAINPPQDVFNADYPEKIVLAFYQSLDAGLNRGWKPEDFLAPDSKALAEYNAKNMQYFGFAGSGKITDLAVMRLQYFPIEEQVNVAQTIEGAQPKTSRVEVIISAQQGGQPVSSGLIKFETVFLSRQWKINKVID